MPVNLGRMTAEVLAEGDMSDFAARFLRRILPMWEDERAQPALIGLVRSAMTDEAAAATLQGFIRTELLDRIAAGVGTEDARLRSAVFGSQLLGLLLYRHVLRVEPLASMDHEPVVEAVAPGLQRALTGGP
jgi:hypothetical protein